MAVIERTFRMAAEGASPQAILAWLYEEGVHSPRGDRTWVRRTLEQILRSDLYRAHTREELAGLLSPEVLARLDEDSGYGIWWFGCKSVRQRQVSEPDGNGGQRYRKATTTRIRSVEERTAVPVPCRISRSLVDQARDALAASKPM